MSAVPAVYLLHGDDEVGINEFIADLRERMGNPSAADMNTVRIEGRVELGELKDLTNAIPFLSARRLVVLHGSAGTLSGKNQRADFLRMLESVPHSTALVLVEAPRKNKKRKEWYKHLKWLLAWAAGQPEQVYVKKLAHPKGGALASWVKEETGRRGGEISPQAAQRLVGLIGDDKRLASSEIDKLLAYVNYGRAIDMDDVELVTATVLQADVFAMVDAIGARNGRAALTRLHELLAERGALPIFGMIVRQFRLLLMLKQMQAENYAPAAVARALHVPNFVVSKLAGQARNFDAPGLDAIFQRLAGIDAAFKTGEMPLDVALDVFVADVTTR